MFGTFPSPVHSVFSRIADREYTVQQRCPPLLRRTFQIGLDLSRMANRRFQRQPGGSTPMQVFTSPRNQETPIFHRLQITYRFPFTARG
jgi:hypothetical protein